MFFFRFIGNNLLLAFVLLNILFIDLGQFSTVCRKGYGQIVSLAGYYGDRVLVVLILIIGFVLTKNKVEFESNTVTKVVIFSAVYAISVFVALKYLPRPAVEDTYHHFVVLPAYVLILLFGVFKAFPCASAMERSGMIACFGIYLALLLIDIKTGRLDQVKYMATHGLKS